ncbi:MAG: hypothetical protein LBF90_03990, partial [Prevotellaceae bacterium]|nr:hypothetical protein [Prevotellaceae bacterium]
MTKKFSGTYQGKSFSVVFSIHYNTSNPDYFTQSATVDVTNVASGTSVSLAYGFDSYVNGCDAAAAMTIPDLGFNDQPNPSAVTRILSAAQVQSLRMAGAMNTRSSGSLIGFFSMGRPFSRAVSAYYTYAYYTNQDNITMISAAQSLFLFGPYNVPTCTGGSVWDNGLGIAYDNIPSGEVTTIWTGLTFTTDMDGELDYTWNGSKNYTANVGDSVNLELTYESYNSQAISGIGFHVAIPGLEIKDVCTQTGFTAGVFTGTIGSQFYEVSGAAINAYDSAVMLVPVNILQCGQWVIDANSISAMARTLPLGSPATLTVPSKVSFAQEAYPSSICRGDSITYTIKLPDGVTSAASFSVNLAYAGNTSAFAALPASVAFPAGTNSVSFTIRALPGAPANSLLTITLTGSDKPYISVNDALLTVVNVLVSQPNVITAQNVAVCPGTETTISAYSQDATATLTWYSDAGATTPIAQANSFTITTVSDTVFYVKSTSVNSCPNTASVQVSIHAPPALTVRNDTTVCVGASVTIDAHTANSTDTIRWYGDAQHTNFLYRDNFTIATVDVPDVVHTTYYVRAVSERGCTAHDSVRLTVYPFPSLTVQNVAICGSGTVTVAATTTNSHDALTWYRDAQYSDRLSLPPSFNLAATADTTFYIKATAGNLCSVYDSVQVWVSSYAALRVRADTSLCAGTPVTVYASTPNSGDALSWYRDAQHTSLITQGNAFEITATTTTTYYVKVVSESGCSSSDEVLITVFQLPVLTVKDTTVCAGSTIVLSASTTQSADTLRWYGDANYTSLLAQTLAFTPPPLAANTTFYVVASSAPGGCRTTGSLSVKVTPPPAVVAMDDRRICYGDEITLLAEQSDGTLTWNVNNTTLRPTATASYVATASRWPCPDARDTVTITVGDLLFIKPDALPPYRRNIPYTQQLTTNAEPPVFSIVDGELPAGLQFRPDGTIDGLPFQIEYNDAGYPFRVQVTDQ